MSLRLSEELYDRLEECARRLKVKKHALAQDAIEAAVEAIEKHGGLVIPIKFDVSQVPIANPGLKPNSPSAGTVQKGMEIIKQKAASKRAPRPE